MDIMAVVKEHPLPIGIGVLVLIIVIASSRSSGSSASSNGDAQADATNLQSQNIAASQSVALGAQSTQQALASTSAGTDRQSIAASLFASLAQTQAVSDMNSSNNTVQLVTAAFQNTQNQTQLADSLKLQEDTNTTNAGLAYQSLADQLKAVQDSNATSTANIAATAAGNVSQINASTAGTEGVAAQSYNFLGANLATLLQHSENLAKIQGSTATQLATIQTSPSLIAAQNGTLTSQANANAANAQSGASWVSTAASVIGAVGEFFGG